MPTQRLEESRGVRRVGREKEREREREGERERERKSTRTRERKRERKHTCTRERKREGERERERKSTCTRKRKREKVLWLLLLYVFSSTWACLMQIGLSQECCLFYLKSSL